MAGAKSTKTTTAKPYPDFPLFPHQRGYWAKKIRGNMHYFGPVADPDAALNKYLEQRDDLHAGRTPRTPAGGLTIRDLCNRFLAVKEDLVKSGELSPRTWQDYHSTAGRLLDHFGKARRINDLASDDFESLRANLGKTWGPVAVGNEINRIRVVFKYAFDAGLIELPVRYGPHFKRPNRRVLRQSRAAKGPRMFEALQLQKVITSAGMQLKAMVLLGINCGLGNADCGKLEMRHIDFKGGWLNYPRPKTGIVRRCPLWPDTIAALRRVLEIRPEPKDPQHDDLVFITRRGASWTKDVADSPVSKEFDKILRKLKLKRPGLSFYALRHTHETIGGNVGDQVAVDHIRGHAPAFAGMGAVYRERISDERLKAVTDHVRMWLWPKGRKAK